MPHCFSHIELDLFDPSVWNTSSQWFNSFLEGLPYNQGVSTLRGITIGLETSDIRLLIRPKKDFPMYSGTRSNLQLVYHLSAIKSSRLTVFKTVDEALKNYAGIPNIKRWALIIQTEELEPRAFTSQDLKPYRDHFFSDQFKHAFMSSVLRADGQESRHNSCTYPQKCSKRVDVAN